MPLEPLRTDEKLDRPEKTAQDMDAQMLFGCSGFLIAAVAGYLVSIWPFVAFQQTEQLRWLIVCMIVGPGPAAVIGGFSTRRFGLGGASGFVGGALCTGIFIFLRIQFSFTSYLAEQAPRPEYPEVFQYLVPLAYILGCLLLAVSLLPKDELSGENPGS